MPDQNPNPVRFARFDPISGEILACFDNTVHKGTIPPDALEMTDVEFFGHINHDPRLAVDVQADPPVFIVAITEEPTLDQVKDIGKARVIRWINALTMQMRAGYPSDEVASWPAKAMQARAVLAGADPVALILSEATKTGETPMEVAQNIVANADITESVIGTISGMRRNLMAEIDAAIDPIQVEAAIDTALAAASAEALTYGMTVPE